MSQKMKTSSLEMTLPSGRLASFHELDVSDANIMADKKKRNTAMNDVIGRRTMIVEETDNGEVSEKELNPKTSYYSDVFTAIVGVRRVTHGDDFEFDVKCPDCGEKQSVKIDLTDEYFQPKMIPMSDNPEDGVTEKGEFVIELFKPHGGYDKLLCRLLTGKHQDDIARITKRKSESIVSETMKLKVVGVYGMVDPATKSNAPDKQRILKPNSEWFETLPLRTQLKFNKAYDEFYGGIESSVKEECTNGSCMNEFDVDIPFNDPRFFLPT